MATARTLSPRGRTTGSLAACVVSLVTFAVFSASLRNGFVNWDDTFNLLNNPNYRGLDGPHLRWMFGVRSLVYGGHYMPLPWMTLGLDYLFWGMDPRGYHLTSLVIHSVNAALAFFVARRLLAAAADFPPDPVRLDAASAFAALFFALHPLRVEVAAWASERNDVLCGFFCLLTVLCCLNRRLLLAGSCFACSLLSKEAGITLPFVLLVFDVYPLRRLPADPKRWNERKFRRIWLEKIPFLLLSCAAGVMGLRGAAAIRMLRPFSPGDDAIRASLSAFSTAFYLWKTAAPFHLLPLYALPVPFDPLWCPSLLGGAVAVSLTAFFYLNRKRLPAGLAVWASYLILLAPVMGFVGKGQQLAADRYTYLPCLSWAVLAGGVLLRFLPKADASPLRRISSYAPPALILTALSVLAWRQTNIWKDSETLWTYVLSVDPSCATAHNDLGYFLTENGRFAEALPHYRAALRADPSDVVADDNLAFALAKSGKTDEAIVRWQELLRLHPENFMAQNNLGYFLAQKGEFAEAIRHYREALRAKPGFSWARENLCLALSRLGEAPQADDSCGK